MTAEQKLEALDRLYARLPTIQCKGLCVEYCGLVPMYQIEINRIAERTGERPRVALNASNPPRGHIVLQEGVCPLLTAAGRCSVYDIRPAICRMFGTAKDMLCPHGCRPNRWLSDKESRSIMRKIKAIEERT